MCFWKISLFFSKRLNVIRSSYNTEEVREMSINYLNYVWRTQRKLNNVSLPRPVSWEPRDGKFGVTDLRGGNWSVERHCVQFANALQELCSVADIEAGSTGAGACVTRLNSWGTVPCRGVSAVLWSPDWWCCLGHHRAALLCKQQLCPKSFHLAMMYRVCWEHLCGILWAGAYGLSCRGGKQPSSNWCDCLKELPQTPGLANPV